MKSAFEAHLLACFSACAKHLVSRTGTVSPLTKKRLCILTVPMLVFVIGITMFNFSNSAEMDKTVSIAVQATGFSNGTQLHLFNHDKIQKIVLNSANTSFNINPFFLEGENITVYLLSKSNWLLAEENITVSKNLLFVFSNETSGVTFNHAQKN